MAILITMTKSALKDAIKHHATLNNLSKDKIQIVIGLKNEADHFVPDYYVMKDFDYYNKQNVTYTELTGSDFDLMNKEELSKQNFPKYFQKIAEKQQLDPIKMQLVIVSSTDSKLAIFLYHNAEPIGNISFEYFFGEE